MKMLVAYASKRGSTAEIAEAISGMLRRGASRSTAQAAEDVRASTPTTPSSSAAPCT